MFENANAETIGWEIQKNLSVNKTLCNRYKRLKSLRMELPRIINRLLGLDPDDRSTYLIRDLTNDEWDKPFEFNYPNARGEYVPGPWKQYFEGLVNSIMDRNIDVYQETRYLNIEVNALQERLEEVISNWERILETQELQELKEEEGLSAECVVEEVLQGNGALKGEIQSLQVMVENDRPDSVQGQGLQEVQADQNINERILLDLQELENEEGLSGLREDQESMKSEPLTSEEQEMHDTKHLLEMNKMLEEDIERLQQVIPELLNKMSAVEERLGQMLQGNKALKGEIQSLQVMAESDRPDSVLGQGLEEVQQDQNISERILQELKEEEGFSALSDEQEQEQRSGVK